MSVDCHVRFPYFPSNLQMLIQAYLYSRLRQQQVSFFVTASTISKLSNITH